MSTAIAPTRPAYADPRLVDQPGFRLGLAHGVLVLVVALGDALDVRHGLVLGLLAAVALVGGTLVTPRGAVLLGASCWAFWTGFLEHGYGQLTLGGDDLARLGLLVALAVAGAAARRAVRRG